MKIFVIYQNWCFRAVCVLYTHLQLAPRLGVSGDVPPFPEYAFLALIGTTWPLPYLSRVILGELPRWERRHTFCISDFWHQGEVELQSCYLKKNKRLCCCLMVACFFPEECGKYPQPLEERLHEQTFFLIKISITFFLHFLKVIQRLNTSYAELYLITIPFL
jgi:hypothetical protein